MAGGEPIVNAVEVAKRLLEADELDWTPDLRDPDEDMVRLAETAEFDEGAEDIVADARRLWLKAKKSGALEFIHKADTRSSGLGGPDNLSVAQAFIYLAIQKRGAKGTQNVLRLMQRHLSHEL